MSSIKLPRLKTSNFIVGDIVILKSTPNVFMVVEQEQPDGLLCTWLDSKKTKQSGVFAASSLRRPPVNGPLFSDGSRVPNFLFVIWYYVINFYKYITYISIFSIVIGLLKSIVSLNFSDRVIEDLQLLAVATILGFILTIYSERLETKAR